MMRPNHMAGYQSAYPTKRCCPAPFVIACALAFGFALAPFRLDLATGQLSLSAAWAKDGGAKGNGNGGKSEGKGNSGGAKGGSSKGSSNSGGASGSAGDNDNGGSAGSSGSAGNAGNSGKSSNAGGSKSDSDSSGSGQPGASSTDAAQEAAAGSIANQSAVNSAREKLQQALGELVAARQAYDRANQSGDDVLTAVAKGRLARAELGLSSAKMNVVVAEAGYAAAQ